MRNRGAYPNARCFAGHNGPKPITVWCSNDYLAMGQHAAVIEAMQARLAGHATELFDQQRAKLMGRVRQEKRSGLLAMKPRTVCSTINAKSFLVVTAGVIDSRLAVTS